MITIVGEKRCHFRRFLEGVVVRKLSEGKQVEPVVLIITAEDAEVNCNVHVPFVYIVVVDKNSRQRKV